MDVSGSDTVGIMYRLKPDPFIMSGCTCQPEPNLKDRLNGGSTNLFCAHGRPQPALSWVWALGFKLLVLGPGLDQNFSLVNK